MVGLAGFESRKWESICIAARRSLEKRLRPGVARNENEFDARRLELAAAAMAARRYRLIVSGTEPSSFQAGDISVRREKQAELQEARALEEEMLMFCSDLLYGGDGLFLTVGGIS